ncbi:hypothetical protein HIM_01438 [Hirsutella minnesotensis 3608]|nr:hypothetical protein HIM_01438 [Hirsutella minnesotensis 3608]
MEPCERIDSPSTAAVGERDLGDNLECPSPDLSSTPRDFDSSNILGSKDSFTSYHRPMRSETPTSTASTISTTGLWLQGQDFRSMTPPDDGSLSRPAAIGMALGSPSHLPPSQYTTDIWPHFQPSVITTVEAQRPIDKKQSKKWGIFTRSRSKKGRTPESKQDNQRAAPSSSPLSGRAPTPDNANQPTAPPKPRTLVKARAEPKKNRRTNSPIGMHSQGSPNSQTIGAYGMTGALMRDGSPLSPKSPRTEKLLDVEIPDVSMERYSVMFGHLIEDLDSTSLHGRRQATRDRIKAIQDDHAQDSAPMRPLPSTTMAVSTGKSGRVAARDRSPERLFSPAQRSNSFPETLTSPIHPKPSTKNVSRGYVGGPHHVAASSRSGAISFMEPEEVNSAEVPRLISRFHRRSSSDQGPSPYAPAYAPSPTIPKDEPYAKKRGISPMTWNTAHPPHPLPDSGPKAAARPSISPVPASPVQSRETSPHGTRRDPSLPDPVQVSIARQISISRQQKVMLESLRKPGLESRVVSETKSATPKLVDPRQDLDSPTAVHRKMSETVIVEGV